MRCPGGWRPDQQNCHGTVATAASTIVTFRLRVITLILILALPWPVVGRSSPNPIRARPNILTRVSLSLMSVDRCELLCIDFDHAESLRAALPEADPLDRQATRLRALGDPTRLRIAHALLVGTELCVCDLAWIVGSSQGLVSHHLRQLRAAGLVASRRDGKLVMYRLAPSGEQLLSATTAPEVEADPV